VTGGVEAKRKAGNRKSGNGERNPTKSKENKNRAIEHEATERTEGMGRSDKGDESRQIKPNQGCETNTFNA